MKFRWILAVVCLLPFASTLRADGVTVTTSSPGWVQIAPGTFVLPADLSVIGCGAENVTTCEPQGQFNFNVSFATSGVFDILNANGTLSDVIQFSNSNGQGVVTFTTEPVAGQAPSGPILCQESSVSGCTATFTIDATNGTVLTLTAASDGESFFDPLGAGFDTSDALQVKSTPEPASLALLTIGLMGMATIFRKKLLSP
jgi:hypothetical protein